MSILVFNVFRVGSQEAVDKGCYAILNMIILIFI